jgi:hypothetical protein
MGENLNMASTLWNHFSSSVRILPFLAIATLFVLAMGCSSEEEKKPQVSANLCLFLPNGNKLGGPYDTKKACDTAQENLPQSECKPCQEKNPQGEAK